MTLEEFFEKWRDGPMDTSVNHEMRVDLDALLASRCERYVQAIQDYVRVLIYPSVVTPEEIGASIVKIIRDCKD